MTAAQARVQTVRDAAIERRLAPIPLPRSEAKIALLAERVERELRREARRRGSGRSIFDAGDPDYGQRGGLLGQRGSGTGGGFSGNDLYPVAVVEQNSQGELVFVAARRLPTPYRTEEQRARRRAREARERAKRVGQLSTAGHTGHNGRNMKHWTVTLPDGRQVSVHAYTAGEARAHAKTFFRIPKKGRLPVGTIVQRLRFSSLPARCRRRRPRLSPKKSW